MSNDNVFALKNPAVPNEVRDALTDVLREGARMLLAQDDRRTAAVVVSEGHLHLFGLGLLFFLPGLWLANFGGPASRRNFGIAFVIVLVAAIIHWYMGSRGQAVPLWINYTAAVLVLLVLGWHFLGPRSPPDGPLSVRRVL